MLNNVTANCKERINAITTAVSLMEKMESITRTKCRRRHSREGKSMNRFPLDEP